MWLPQDMCRIRLHLLREQLPAASLALAEFGRYAPASPDDDNAGHLTGEGLNRLSELHRQATGRLDKICSHFGLRPPLAIGQPRMPTLDELGQLNDRLGDCWRQCSAQQERARALDERQRELNQRRAALNEFAGLDIDLGLLDRPTRFVDIHVGAVNRFNVPRLREALGLTGYLLYEFLQDGERSHVLIAGPRDGAGQRVQALLQAAAFKPLEIPPELRDQPARVSADLERQQSRVDQQRAQLAEQMRISAAQSADLLAHARQRLAEAEPATRLGVALRDGSYLALLHGWVPARDVEPLRRHLESSLPGPILLDARPPRPDEYPEVPSHMPRHPLLEPFATLVRQYGVPRYREIDPSPLFAISLLAMFGMMFGDVGQGLCIALGALLLRRRLGRFTGFGVLAGLSSAGFGLVYGSVFGSEALIHPLWQSPIHDPSQLLGLALGWGIGFLLLMLALSMVNRLLSGDWPAALASERGLAGVALYLGLIAVGEALYRGQAAPLGALLVIGGALTAIGIHRWQHDDSHPGERALVIAVELFEAVINALSGMLSFLRVAAFSINHVALAIAVFTLADMLEPVGSSLMLIGGNLFILVLEGAIVAIQVLRLEYYEGFSRFYSGDGHAFHALALPPAAPGHNWPPGAIPTSGSDR